MQGWTDGYVTEIEYTNCFYGELAPPLLSFAMLLRGVRPANDPTFSYCELGCGHGYSTNLLAAAHPQARFVGVDFNAAHITSARALAEAASLQNVAFEEASFADFAHGDEAYDFITMHGVWSWVGPESRAHLIDLIRRRLKPGGVVYVSYNCLPGWAIHAPLRQLLALHVDDMEGPLASRLETALGFAGQLAATQAGYFAKAPGAARRLEILQELPRAYVAHEYLNRNWSPFYHIEVGRLLAEAGLSFAAPAVPLDQLDAYAVSGEGRVLLQQAKDPAYRETLRDYLTNTTFRRDVFVKDIAVLGQAERLERLCAVRFAMTTTLEVPQTLDMPLGKVELPQDLYHPLVEALVEAPRTLGELLEWPAVGRHGLGQVLGALMVLTGTGKAAPVPERGPDDDAHHRRTMASRFNLAVLQRDPLGDELRFLASPVIGSGVSIGRGEGLFLLARLLGRDPGEVAWEQLDARGMRVTRDGCDLQDREEIIAEMRRRDALFVDRRLPLMRSLGIV